MKTSFCFTPSICAVLYEAAPETRTFFLNIWDEAPNVGPQVKEFPLYIRLLLAFKAPFNESERVASIINRAHKDLQSALCKLYPGGLVLSINSEILHGKLIKMITDENDVPLEPYEQRRFGSLMCVPFGEMLKGSVVPNTVTKTLHTEKVFNRKIDSFTIEEFPLNYSLPTRRLVKRFNY